VGQGNLGAPMRKFAWFLLLMAGCAERTPSEQKATSHVAVKDLPNQPMASSTSEEADDLIADKIAATPPQESDGIPTKNDPAYGAIIRLTHMKKANAKIVPGRSLKLWLEDLTPEQRLAVELQRLSRNTDDFFRRGWDAEVPALLTTLRKDIGTPAAKVAANDLERLARLVRPANADGVRGEVFESSELSESIINRCRERQAKIEDALDRDVAAYLHRLWCERVRASHGRTGGEPHG